MGFEKHNCLIKYCKVLLLFSLLITDSCKKAEQKNVVKQKKYEFESIHMGTNFNIVLYAQDSVAAHDASSAAFAKIAELDSTLSDYIAHSELSRLSSTSGKDSTVLVSSALFDLLSTAKEISFITNGLFDITVGPYVSLWRSIKKLQPPLLPTARQLKQLDNSVGYRNLILNETNQSVRLTQPGMKLDVGGIGKGYATQKALEELQKMGIESCYVDGGGDISIGSPPPGKVGWTIAVPLYRSNGSVEIEVFELSNVSIATSGDLYQYVSIDGTRYSHIIDPRTGLGSTKQIQSTVIAPDGALADALASTISVAGIDRSKAILANFGGTAAYVTQTTGDSLRIWQSGNLDRYLP